MNDNMFFLGIMCGFVLCAFLIVGMCVITNRHLVDSEFMGDLTEKFCESQGLEYEDHSTYSVDCSEPDMFVKANPTNPNMTMGKFVKVSGGTLRFTVNGKEKVSK